MDACEQGRKEIMESSKKHQTLLLSIRTPSKRNKKRKKGKRFIFPKLAHFMGLQLFLGYKAPETVERADIFSQVLWEAENNLKC